METVRPFAAADKSSSAHSSAYLDLEIPLPVVTVMAPRKTLAKKTKTISLVSEEDMGSKSKGGRSPIPSSPWEVSTATEEYVGCPSRYFT